MKVEASTGVDLDNVAITGAGTIQVDTVTPIQTVPATLNLDGGTSMTGGTLSIGGSGTLVIQAGGGGDNVTLDGVTVINGNSIEIGGNSVGANLVLDDGTKITGGTLTVDLNHSGNTLEIAYGANGPGATLDGVQVTNNDQIQVDGAVAATTNTAAIPAATLTLDDGAKITGGNLQLGSGAILDVEAGSNAQGAHGATLDHVGVSGGTIDVGVSGAATLTLTDGASTGSTAITVESGSTLDLDGVTITGGSLGGGGTIETAAGNGSSTLNGVTIATGSTVTDSTGTLVLTGTITDHGEIDATTGTLDLDNATVTGGTLGGGGTIETAAGNTSSTLSGVTIASGGKVTDSVGTLVLTGAITDHGEIDATTGTLDLNNATVTGGTLGGSGTIETASGNTSSTLSGVTIATGSKVTDSVGTLVLTGAITDHGEIDATTGTLDLDNATVTGGTLGGSGTIETASGNTSSTLSGVTIGSGSTVTDSTGTLVLTGTITDHGEIDATTGTLDLNNATVTGGTLGGSGTIETASGNSSSTLNGVTIASGSTVTDSVGTLVLTGTITDHGEIDATTGTLDLNNATVTGGTLGGSGTIETAAGNTSSTLNGVTIASGSTVTDSVGTLVLTGTITDHGEIDATTGTLDLDNATVTGGSLGGSGTIETASGNSSSTLNGVTIASGSTVTDSAGTLVLTGTIADHGEIDATTGTLDLDNATVTGGTLGGSGTIETAAGNTSSTLSGVTVASGSTVTDSAGTLVLTGTVTDHGEIDATTGTLDLDNATVTGGTLGGGGTIETAAGNTSSTLNGVTIASGSTVTDSVGTLELTGTITDHGEIDATTGTLDLDNATVTGGTLGGSGTIETAAGNSSSTLSGVTIASGSKITDSTGTLVLTGAITDHGEIDATAGTLDLNNATVTGGTLGGSGTIETASGNSSSTLNGVTIASGSKVTDSVGTLVLTGAITDHGEIDATTGTLDLNNATVTGGTLGGSGTIETAAGNSSSTLSGVTIGSGSKVTDSVGTLVLTGTITDHGEIDATTGTLDLNNATVTGGTLGGSGTIETAAGNSSSTLSGVTIGSGSKVTDSVGTLVLTGTITDHGEIDATTGTLDLNNATVTGGTLGGSGTIETAAGNTSSTLSGVTIASGSKVTDSAGTLVLTGAITDHGEIDATTGTLDLDNATVTGGTLGGSGTIETAAGNSSSTLSGVTIASGSTVTDSTGTLVLTGTITDHGEIDASTGTLDLNNATVTGGTLGGSGTIETAAGNSSSTLSGVTIASGSTVTDSTGTLVLTGTITDHGEIDATTGTLDLNNATVTGGTLGGSGTIETAAGNTSSTLNGVTIASGSTVTDSVGTLVLTGAITDHGEIDATTGTLDLNNATVTGGTLGGGGTIETASGNTSSTLSGVTIASGSTVTDSTGTLVLTGAITDHGEIDATTGTLDLNNATVTGGTLGGGGTIETASGNTSSTLSGVTIASGSTVTDSVGTLVLTGTITDHGEIDATTGTLDLNNATVTGGTLGGGGTIETASGNTSSTLSGVTIASGSTVTDSVGTLALTGTITDHGEIDATTGTLDLDNATVTGGTLDGGGTIETAAGNSSSTLSGVTIGSGSTVTDSVGTLALTGAITDHGEIDATTGTLDLNNATVTGGTLGGSGTIETASGNSSSTLSGVTIASGSTVTDSVGTLVLTGTITNTSAEIDVGTNGTADLNSATINGGTITISGILDSTGTSFITGATIVNSNNIQITSGTLTIDPTPVTNTGTILVTDDSTLVLDGETITNSVTDPGTHATTNGKIEVDATDATHVSTLDLEGSTIDGGTLTISGTLDSTGSSFITGASITNSGTIDVTSGTLTIDATSTLINTGTIETDGGNLILNAALSGNLEIKGASTFELGASDPSAYSHLTVTFDPGATGTLVLDHAESFKGTIAGLDDNKLDLADVAYGSNTTVSYSGTATAGVLSIYVNGIDVSDIHLTGDYLGVRWALADDGSAQHGTTVAEIPGVISSGLDSSGNATEGTPLVASITDGGAPANATYTWQIFENGAWVPGSGTGVYTANYTPGGADQGNPLRVSISYVDALGESESATISAGTVDPAAPVVTVSAPAANENGSSTLVLGLTNAAELFANSADSVTLTVALDHGATLSQTGTGAAVIDNHNGTFTLTATSVADLNGLTITPATEFDGTVTVDVSAVTHDGAVVSAAGTAATTLTVNPIPDLAATLDSTTAKQNVAIDVTGVTDGGIAVNSGITYDWQISSDGTDWTEANGPHTGSSYTPVAADVGDALRVVVTYTDSVSTESTTDYLVGDVASALKYWNGGSHDWHVGSQWTPSGAPTSSDDVVIDASGSYTVRIDQNAAAHSLTLNHTEAAVEIVDGNTLTLGGDLTIDAGTVWVDSGGTLKDTAANAMIAGTFINNGTIEAAGGKLEVASSVLLQHGGLFKIDAGATLQFDHSDALNVAFAGSGELVLKDPTHFTGIISDSGGSLTNSDVVDVAGFDATASVVYNGTAASGTVTISEANHETVTLHVGANSTHWSAPVTDGNGGILIHDPVDDAGGQAAGPVVANAPGPAASQTVVASVPNQTLSGFAASDNFVFNFAGLGHDTVTDFHPATDTLQFASSIFANAQAALDATHDDGLGNTVVALDGHDTITLAGVLKAQLHFVDFHIA